MEGPSFNQESEMRNEEFTVLDGNAIVLCKAS